MEQKSYANKTYEKRGNPFKRGNTWTYIYYIADSKTGSKKQKWCGGYKTKKEAEEALKECEAIIRSGQYIEDKKLTLEEYITRWFNDVHKPKLQPNTINGYEVNIKNHIIPHIGKLSLAAIKRRDIEKFYNSLLEENLSITTVKYVRNVLRKALKEAVLDGVILKNPCEGIVLPKSKKYRSVVLNNQQIKLLLKEIIGTDVELEVMLALSLGLRRGEVLGLKFSDFDFVNRTVRIHQQVTTNKAKSDCENKQETIWGIKDLKTENSNRIVYVPTTVLETVKKRQMEAKINKLKFGAQYHDYDLVCCEENGMYLSPQTVYHRFKRIIAKSGLPDIRFHDLRHSCATALLESDIQLKIISQMLGHSSIKITADIYCDVLEKRKQPAEVMENTFFCTAVK